MLASPTPRRVSLLFLAILSLLSASLMMQVMMANQVHATDMSAILKRLEHLEDLTIRQQQQQQSMLKLFCPTVSPLTLHQAMRTRTAADWEFFSIGSENYLAVANFEGPSSEIFKFDRTSLTFQPFQTIATFGARAWKFFTIKGESFLVVANSASSANSHIFKFDNLKEQFELFQTVSTQGAVDWEFFVINPDSRDDGDAAAAAAAGAAAYLAVANHCSDHGNCNVVTSHIYKFDSVFATFQPFQAFATRGARDWEFFSIEGDSFLALANYGTPPQFFKFDGDKFNPMGEATQVTATPAPSSHQRHGKRTIATTPSPISDSSFVNQSSGIRYAHDWEYFSIKGESYLAVAIAFDQHVQPGYNKFNSFGGDFYHNNNNNNNNAASSRIYKYNSLYSKFSLFQVIPVQGRDWEFFTVNGNSYLALASHRETTSKVFKFVGSQFQPFATIPLSGVVDWAYFAIDNTSYLAAACAGGSSSSTGSSGDTRSEASAISFGRVTTTTASTLPWGAGSGEESQLIRFNECFP